MTDPEKPSGMDYETESSQDVPVFECADVAVVGAGVSGVFSALGAADRGARTVLMDRFGQVGGNMGPGLFIGSRLYDEPGKTLHVVDYPGIPRRFVDRLETMIAGDERHRRYPYYTNAISRLAQEMLNEAGVSCMLSVYAGDPVMDDRCVRGVFIETKSGRGAVSAGVVVDASGDASIADRAGAPIARGSTPEECDSPIIWEGYRRPEYRNWNDGGIYFVLSGVDLETFQTFSNADCHLSAEDEKWFGENLGYYAGRWKRPAAPILRQGWETGEYRVLRNYPGPFHICLNNWFEQIEPGLVGGRAQVHGDYDSGDHAHASLIEAELRSFVFDSVQFLRKHMPGFENACLLFASPFLGSRGGPRIVGEYVLTPDDIYEGRSFEDTLFRSYVGLLKKACPEGFDMPYRMLVPKGVDGLLVTGRGASYKRRGHDPGVRARCNLMMLGQATGAAAALAVREGVPPRKIDVRALQKDLFAQGYRYGNDARLSELGLA